MSPVTHLKVDRVAHQRLVFDASTALAFLETLQRGIECRLSTASLRKELLDQLSDHILRLREGLKPFRR